MDSLMHRMGLHGKAIIPFILGYGCNVPAVMSTRTLEEPADRYRAAALATLVPCAARLAVVFGLVAYYLGPLPALLVYLFNLFVIGVTGRILTRLQHDDSPGLILEIPPYRAPTLRAVVNKAWFRIREFVVEAWPALIAGSAVLALLGFLRLESVFNLIVRPFTWVLGLPAATGIPLIFGVLRKELSLVMLGQALGTLDFAAAMSPVQLFTYTVFVVFYIPCTATLMVLRRELGTRGMLSITAITLVVALLAALVGRGLAMLVL
jgi:ferrous iron transport protein B